ncbi:G patch domain-containing protein 3 [Spea bombifrons]|uniref:G patch domain-containing protein 3 n=1 Tax=Spea bombifrons TaxID=233779 RepID=UPI0023492D96|nr:G patch domain-containing protein 3 [Spea bombifrons]
MAEPSESVLFVISGIPCRFRSAQLRNYFSQLTESGGFVCFHYRHRPESLGPAPMRTGTRCCPVAVKPDRARSFVQMYHGKPWLDTDGSLAPGQCQIRRVSEGPEPAPPDFPYKTRRELLEGRHLGSEEEKPVTAAELRKLSELNPPTLMPQGNVGTPTEFFLQMIRACRLPPRLITKLGLRFPGKGRRYGKVPFLYRGTETAKGKQGVYTASGQEITEESEIKVVTPDVASDEHSGSDDDNDTCEEWERHEALHDDVTTQERSKERLYEEKIELKWEKGGSGLVFYTDAQIWQEKEGDFDEQTADDWDVDMSGYYEDGAGDKDARDYLKMRLETRRREGLEVGGSHGLGGFERFTKGIGRRLMERQGWTDGSGLGASGRGMPDALENEGQNPKCRRGLGYHGEKLQTFCSKKQKSSHFISTVYDEPFSEDMGDALLRRQPSTAMKHRGDSVHS